MKMTSSDVDSQTRTSDFRVHHARLTPAGKFVTPDEIIRMDDEPGHQELCNREQELFLKAIQGDLDMTAHATDAINSLRIVLAADESVRTGEVVTL